MTSPMEDTELGELHVGATYALQAGCPRVEIMPSQVLQLIDEVQAHRAHRRMVDEAAAAIDRGDFTVCRSKLPHDDDELEHVPRSKAFAVVEHDLRYLGVTGVSLNAHSTAVTRVRVASPTSQPFADRETGRTLFEACTAFAARRARETRGAG